jgi:outer membrane protein OmpA-like peptidoglycan-associated protein
MVSGTARAAEPQIILAQAQTPQQLEEDKKKKLQQQQQQQRGQGQPQQQQPHAQQPQQPQPRNAQGAQPPQQQNAQEQQQRLQQQRQAQEQQQKALEQRQQQQKALQQQNLQQQKQAQEQQQKALEQRQQQQKALQQQNLQQQKQAQEQQQKALEQRQQQQKALEQQNLQQQKQAQEQQQKALEQRQQQQKALEQQQHLHQQAQEKAIDQQKATAAQHQQELLKQQEAQRKAMEDARFRNDQVKMRQLQDQQRHTEQEVQLERQRGAMQQQQAQQQRGILRRELSVEEQKAKAEREAHRADRERLIEQQRRMAEAERSQAAINERLRLQNERLRVIASQRREIVDAGGHKYIQEPGNRTIFSVNNQTFIRHDESVNFRLYGGKAQTQRGPNGNMISNIYRPDGGRIEVEVDSYGRPMRRVRYLPDGRRFVLFENRAIAAGIGLAALGAFVVSLPPAHVEIPRSQYIVDASAASEDDIYGALQAPPVEPLDRTYSLDEVLASVSLRERMRSISIDTINFEFGSAEIGPEQAVMLESVAAAIRDASNANPGEVFLIEGHTDAVGSDQDNLSLSDRRAQAVADVLSQQFSVPRENLVTQGYGEQFLLVSTDGPERRNRRVVVRRISPLLQGEQDRYTSGYGAPDTPEGEARQ